MKTEISRDSHQAEKRYSGVYQQQGRMLTDADWNELVEILKGRVNDALRDVVGSREGSVGGTPRHRALRIESDSADTFSIRPGRVYVDGVAAWIPGESNVDYTDQPDFPSPPDLPDSGDYVLYGDIWERSVTHLLDPQLRDPGLHGADTCSRKQVMAQVKWCPYDAATPSDPANDPETSVHNPARGDAGLSLALWRKTADPDPCDPCADVLDVESKIGNYLFRVEVHDVQGNADAPTEITLKWSSENGAEQTAALTDVEAMPPGFISDKWVYEFFDEISETHLGVHLGNSGWSPTRAELKHFATASDYAVPEFGGTPEYWQYVRRWDGFCTLKLDPTRELLAGYDRSVPLHTGSSELGQVSLDDSVVIKLDAIILELALNDRAFVAGDYWLAEVREAEHDLTGSGSGELIANQAPRGIEHRFLTLGTVVGGTLRDNQEAGRKYAFPPLSEMTRLFHVGGDGQEAMPNHLVPQSLKVGVSNGEWPVGGAAIHFEVTEGGGQLEPHPDFPWTIPDTTSPIPGLVITAADSPTDPNLHGQACCRWKLGPGDRRQRVTAKLVDPDSSPLDSEYPRYLDHPPIHFYANLSTADQVAYTNPGCDDATSVNQLLNEDEGVTWPDYDGDGDVTVKDVLDALLCKLRADHVPYVDPACGGSTVRTLLADLDVSGDGHLTVRDVLDTLLCRLAADHVPYVDPACGGNTVRTLLADLDATGDGHLTVRDVLDTLLCRLEAQHVPYDPAPQDARWGDINDDSSRPTTVQQAIDDLAENLESTDVRYVGPECPDSPSVASGLGISPGTTYKVDEIFDKLLCELDATGLPIDRGADLCEAIKDDPSVQSVQDAINKICRLERGGGCAVTVGEKGQFQTLDEALAKLDDEREICICLMPGDHRVDKLDLTEKSRVVIKGCGSRVFLRQSLYIEADEIEFDGIRFDANDFKSGDSSGIGALILASRSGGRVAVKNCWFSRSFTGTEAEWRPMLTIGKRSRLEFIGNTSSTYREIFTGRSILPAEGDVPNVSREALKEVEGLWRINPYVDPVNFDANARAAAEKLAGLSAISRNAWVDNRPTESIAVSSSVVDRFIDSGSRRVDLSFGTETRIADDSTLDTFRRVTETRVTPQDEVDNFYAELGATGTLNAEKLAEIIVSIAVTRFAPDYALALSSHDVSARITGNHVDGYIGLHFEQADSVKVSWPTTAADADNARKKAWASKHFGDDLVPRGELKIESNSLQAVHSMMPRDDLKLLHEILRTGSDPGGLNIQSYDSLSVCDNVIHEKDNSWIGRFSSFEGNHFLYQDDGGAILAFAMAFRAVFDGTLSFITDQSDFADYMIEQISVDYREGPGFIRIV